MVWLLVAVILGVIVYMVSIVGEYRVFAQDIEPRIDDLVQKADRYEEGALEETEKRNRVKERLRIAREANTEIQREARLVEAQLIKSRELFEHLELKAYKLDFKAKK